MTPTEKNIAISASVVVYRSYKNQVRELVSSLLTSPFSTLIFILDNDPAHPLGSLIPNANVHYIVNDSNIGYGAAHNKAIFHPNNASKYHLILNPDIAIPEGTLPALIEFMEDTPDAGLLMPNILNRDGTTQYLCKLLPRSRDLFIRRFIPFRKTVDRMNRTYELRFTGYDEIMTVPYLSGCFLFCRTGVLRKVGGFDERFFMYLEDTDLTRRVHRVAKTLFYPKVSVYHNYEKGSYKSVKLLWHHIGSSIKYFNKWGWFFDKDRREINMKTLAELGYKGHLNTRHL